MALIPRKNKTIERVVSYRDDRLFYIACDDTYAPKQYFEFFNLPRVKLISVPTEDGSSHASYVLNRLLSSDAQVDDERWLLLDTDHCVLPQHSKSFFQAISEAKRRGVNVALSSPCFELWLLMHYLDDASTLNSITNAQSVEECLREKIGEYSKKKLKREHYPEHRVASAIKLCAAHDALVKGGNNPTAPTSRVYKLWRKILKNIPKNQLPLALRGV